MSVVPGGLDKFKVLLPRSLRSALAKVPRSKRVRLVLTATATDTIGRVSRHATGVRLRGTKH